MSTILRPPAIGNEASDRRGPRLCGERGGGKRGEALSRCRAARPDARWGDSRGFAAREGAGKPPVDQRLSRFALGRRDVPWKWRWHMTRAQTWRRRRLRRFTAEAARWW